MHSSLFTLNERADLQSTANDNCCDFFYVTKEKKSKYMSRKTSCFKYYNFSMVAFFPHFSLKTMKDIQFSVSKLVILCNTDIEGKHMLKRLHFIIKYWPITRHYYKLCVHKTLCLWRCTQVPMNTAILFASHIIYWPRPTPSTT